MKQVVGLYVAWGWKSFETQGVEPAFLTKDDAISYVQTRARFRTGEIRVLNSTGNEKSFESSHGRLEHPLE